MFVVKVHLPSSKDSSRLHIKKLTTDMSLFRHILTDLVDSVHFHALDLRTSNMDIFSEVGHPLVGDIIG
jgi:hypothetical protein